MGGVEDFALWEGLGRILLDGREWQQSEEWGL